MQGAMVEILDMSQVGGKFRAFCCSAGQTCCCFGQFTSSQLHIFFLIDDCFETSFSDLFHSRPQTLQSQALVQGTHPISQAWLALQGLTRLK